MVKGTGIWGTRVRDRRVGCIDPQKTVQARVTRHTSLPYGTPSGLPRIMRNYPSVKASINTPQTMGAIGEMCVLTREPCQEPAGYRMST